MLRSCVELALLSAIKERISAPSDQYCPKKPPNHSGLQSLQCRKIETSTTITPQVYLVFFQEVSLAFSASRKQTNHKQCQQICVLFLDCKGFDGTREKTPLSRLFKEMPNFTFSSTYIIRHQQVCV